MLTDPRTTEKDVTVLAATVDRLDCLFLHLRENPSLCTNAISQDQYIDRYTNSEGHGIGHKCKKLRNWNVAEWQGCDKQVLDVP